jgi:type III pantothenate kinase
MILSLDVGNTTLHGGLFDGEQLKFQFRRTSDSHSSSDELGVFLRSVLRENGADPSCVTQIAICCVVPDAIYSLRGACQKYFNVTPFLLQAGAKTGLKIRYRNPLEVGADRIADAIAATHLYPNRNLLVIDFGTATTIEVINREGEYLGGSILAGLKISMEALENRTAKLPPVEIVRVDPKHVLGRSTIESIQSGLFFGTVGMLKEFTARLTEECFAGGHGDDKPVILATGGFSGLFEKTGLFDVVIPDLVLKGLNLALRMNS